MTEASDWKAIYKVFHWGIALCIVLDVWWLEDDLHNWAGYLAAGFVISRIALEYFIKSPKYANALAKLVYLFIWFLILSLALTGWMLGTDEYWGDEKIQEWHLILSNVLVGVIVVHLAGLLLNGLYQRQKTWKKMLPKNFI